MLRRSLLLGSQAAQNRIIRNVPLIISYVGSGYEGSTYTSSRGGGQWYANETPISGATGTTYVMTAANEGRSITYRVGALISNAIKLFVPTELPNLVAWWDAAATSTLTVTAGKVSQWNSRVGTIQAVQANSSLQPSWSATGRNGLPTVVATGGQFLEMVNSSALPSLTNTSQVFVTAYSSAANTGVRQLWNQGTALTAQSRILMKLGNNTVNATAFGIAFDTPNTEVWTEEDHIVSAVWNSGNTIRNNVDGQLSMTSKTGLAFSTPNTNSRFFATIDNRVNEWWDGSMQEFMVFSRELTVDERQLIEGYMALKWGLRDLLPINHPHKTSLLIGYPTITLQSGTGYFGSTYSSDIGGGKWYADDEVIPGETAQTYIMDADYEGKLITYRVSGIRSNTIKVFTPADISGLVSWFDAAAETTLTLVGSAVSQWNSKIGNHNVNQTTASRRPTWSATGRNGKPAVIGNVANNTALNYSSISMIPMGSANSHIFITAQQGSTTSWRGFMHFGSGSGTSRYISQSSTNNVAMVTGTTATNNVSSVSWLNSDRLVAAAWVSTRTTLHVDGNNTPTTVNATLNTTGTTGILLNNGVNEPWSGTAQEVMVFSRELTTFERQLVEGYMAAKWELRSLLPINHPYKTSMPINFPIITLQSGSGYFGSVFATTATGGQWYADDTAISGATGQTYTMTSENEGKSITYRNSSGISNSLRYFVPSDVAGLTAWWDASATSTLTLSGSQVASWASRVGTATWSQATAGNRPSWSATGRNNLPALTTAGSPRNMVYTNNAGVFPTGTNTSHTIILGHLNAGGGVFRAILNWANTAGTGRYFGHNNSAQVTFTAASTATDNFSNINWQNVDRIQSVLVTGTASTMHIDGATTPFTRTATYNTAVNTTANLFSSVANSFYWIGSVQDIATYNQALSTSDRQRVEGYLAAKWGLRAQLPSDHPFKTTSPL